MKVLEKTLNKIDGYLMSIERNTETGKYELTVGIPSEWVYQEGETVGYEVVAESKVGAVLRVFALEEDVVIDDLIEFVNIIIDTNKKIVEMKENFENELAKAREELEKKVLSFEEVLEEMTENSFKKIREEQEKLEKQNIKKRKPTTKKVVEKEEEPTDEVEEEELRDKLS